MKKLLIYIGIGTSLYCTNAYCLGITTCPGDSKEIVTITGGQKQIQHCSQIQPNCSNVKCLCCITSPVYTCLCDSGYYSKDADLLEGCTCEKCPVANSTCTSASNFTCNANYYKNGNTCSPCPNSGKSASGSTAITSCYLPKGTTGSDATGTYQYTDDCYYQ